MRASIRTLVLAAFFAAAAHAQEAQGNRLYDEYMARRQGYERRVAEAREEFTALCKKQQWAHVIDKPNTSLFGDNGDSHIELKAPLKAFAQKYTPAEVAAALWDVAGDPGRARDVAAYIRGAEGRRGGMPGKADPYRTQEELYVMAKLPRRPPPREPPKNLSELNPPFPFRPSFTGLDGQQVHRECRDNPALRAEYIGAITKILADPGIRKENPLETKNLLDILFFYLKAEEAIPTTLADYFFYDSTTGEDYRLQEKDLRMSEGGTGLMPGQNVWQTPCQAYLKLFGKGHIPVALKCFSNAPKIARTVETGGGGSPLLAVFYFWRLGLPIDEALQSVEDYKTAHPDLTDEQKEALDEIMTFIREKRFCTDALLKNDKEAVRTWAPSYGKGGAEEP